MTSAAGSPRDERAHPSAQPRRTPWDVAFHLTLSEEDRELLDTLAQRMGCSRTETIARALHLLQAVQEKATKEL